MRWELGVARCRLRSRHERQALARPRRSAANWDARGRGSWELTAAVLFVVLTLVAAGFSAGCRGDGKPTLSDLDGIAELQARFNRDVGKPRIVLLVSPT